jgi:hypothetical protein
LTCAFLPATTARRTNHVSLRQAYVVHFVAALFAVVTIVFQESWDGAAAPASLDSIGRQFIVDIGSLANAFARDPKIMVLAVLGIALLIELGFLGVAYVVMPWGACDEPLGASFRHALRRTWLQTPHLVLIVALMGAIGIPLLRLERTWRASYSIPMPYADNLPSVVVMPTNAAPG